MRTCSTWVLVAAMLALATACGGGDTTDLGKLTKADLAIMVVPPGSLGDLTDGMEIDPEESGFQTAQDQAADTPDPSDDAAQFEQQGYVDGYDLELVAERFDKQGVIHVATGVLEFGSADEARAFIERYVEYDERKVGEEILTGVKLLSLERFDTGRVGDTAIGVYETAIVSGSRLTQTGVWLTRGRVAAGVSIVYTGETTARDEAIRHAEALDERIRKAAAGGLDEKPVSIPKRDTSPTSDEDDTLKPLALALADLPNGATVIREEFVDDAGDTAFEREFEFRPGTKLGGSELASVESVVERLETALDAELLLGFVEGTIRSGDFADMIAEEYGAKVDDPGAIRVKLLETKGIGDGATGFSGTFKTSYGTIEAVSVFFSVGRVVGQLHALAPVGRLRTADALSLARKMAVRMRRDG